MINYGKQSIGSDDIDSVIDVLRSDYLTTGPAVERFEQAFAVEVGAKHAVAVCNGTAALHCITAALGIGPGDEVITTPMTFVATANCVVYQNARPVFADVDPDTLLLSPEAVTAAITPHTKAVIAVDYAGQPCDYDALSTICRERGLSLVADACHSLGASLNGRPCGTLADMTAFSFHPVKPITTGEGGMITTEDPELASRARAIRNQGITSDYRQRKQRRSWEYEISTLGFNYRLSDIHCALGISQLKKLGAFTARRREIAERYNNIFRKTGVVPLAVRSGAAHAFHLYVVRLPLSVSRAWIFTQLHERGIGVNVHYIPVYLHPFYEKHFGYRSGLCPMAESAYEHILSLPIFPDLTDRQVDESAQAVLELCGEGPC